MTTLTQCNREWATRPADQRYLDLPSMHLELAAERRASRAYTMPISDMRARPVTDDNGRSDALLLESRSGQTYAATHYAFGQLARVIGAPAGYLRTLPADLAADCVNAGIATRPQDVSALTTRRDMDAPRIRAVTSPTYGRIWNADVVSALIDRVGDGRTGDWRVPGEFGEAVEISKANTTLFAGDASMFVFLADEEHRIELPNRRAGRMGSFARGFFVGNSEVGAGSLFIAAFLFDYVCSNRMVWGAQEYKEVRVRHTSGAPSRWFDEVMPALHRMANASPEPVVRAIEDARKHRIDNVDAFLAQRWTRKQADAIKSAHWADEGRPIETRWDVTVGATAYARELPNQDDRIEIERTAGALLAA